MIEYTFCFAKLIDIFKPMVDLPTFGLARITCIVSGSNEPPMKSSNLSNPALYPVTVSGLANRLARYISILSVRSPPSSLPALIFIKYSSIVDWPHEIILDNGSSVLTSDTLPIAICNLLIYSLLICSFLNCEPIILQS